MLAWQTAATRAEWSARRACSASRDSRTAAVERLASSAAWERDRLSASAACSSGGAREGRNGTAAKANAGEWAPAGVVVSSWLGVRQSISLLAPRVSTALSTLPPPPPPPSLIVGGALAGLDAL